MNPFAYRTTGLAIKTLSSLLKARIYFHGEENIPKGPTLFVINHFTRIETLLMPYHINRLTGIPIWSLADFSLFKGAFGSFLNSVGGVSTKNPDRDRLIVKTLLTGEAAWIIFPEGRMVKSKKTVEKGHFMITAAGARHPPHTGAATLALRTEFYRRRLREIRSAAPEEAERLLDLFKIDTMAAVSQVSTHIVPVNITYYPIRAKENTLSDLAAQLVENLPERMKEELMTEGTMFLSGVDIDVRFGRPIDIAPYLDEAKIGRDIAARGAINFDDPIPSRQLMRKVSVRVMQRYMSDIYSLTTVNHDHLFSSILRLMPARKIDRYDLRQRAFLAAALDLKDFCVYFHQALQQDQIHLLADDSFHKFRDFLSLSLEKGVLDRQRNNLVKNKSKFTSPLNFHRIRIDNPVEVIANEVEPLTQLQRRLKRLAWTPKFWVRRQIDAHLLKLAESEFQTDYKTFFIKGESKPLDSGRPYLIRGRSRDIGVLVIHGYMASPLEVKELAEYLGRQGLWVFAPRLKGHGTSPADLATRTYKDWVKSVDLGYGIIRNHCRRVVVGGFSTGAGLALDLAARIKDIAGIFAVSPPMRLQDFSSKFVPAVDGWNRIMKRVHWEGAQKEFVENRPENPHINYVRNPVAGIRELERLMEALAPKLGEITSPALVIQSRRDPVVDPKGSRRAFEQLGSADKAYTLFNFNRHGILLGPGAERVHRAINDFIMHLK
ncbi:MAG: alpha/beta fold hydrolase [Desulfobacterales bacterium]|nr:alpha/beta fold hydrolase [Desulfobacterales bacterium]